MKKNVFYLLGIVFLLASCYPKGPENWEELDLVYTDYTEDFDFASKGKYAMPDSIVNVTGNLLEGQDPEFIKEPYNTQILNRIATNMTAMGWTRVDTPEEADLTLLAAVWTNTTIYYWNNYWCWYYYYYCGWGYYGGYYTSSTTGTLAMTLVAAGDEYINPASVWRGAVNGVATGAYDVSRVTEGIDQAFTQSPYLKAN